MTSPLRATTIAIRIGETVYHQPVFRPVTFNPSRREYGRRKIERGIERLARTFLEI